MELQFVLNAIQYVLHALLIQHTVLAVKEEITFKNQPVLKPVKMAITLTRNNA